MGDDMGAGSGSGSNIGADGAPVPTDGTARDFGNMLNAHMPKRVKAKHGDKSFSPWTMMKPKQQEKIK